MPRILGQISLFPYDYEPSGWMFCDGRILGILQNEVLFNQLSNTFGGDGESTFAVPDLRAAAPRECHYCISLEGTFGESFYRGVVGETLLWATSTNPWNLVECAGQSVSTAEFSLLQTYMGARFGGDGANYFQLPDLRDKIPGEMPLHDSWGRGRPELS